MPILLKRITADIIECVQVNRFSCLVSTLPDISHDLIDSHRKDLVLVSGYYGFGNLGDEAILEVLCSQLKSESIVVLSNSPQKTASTFSVAARNRWNLVKVFALFQRTKLFVSGGGGLFQDTSSLRSVIYYSLLHLMARMAGVKVLVYAQGLGPLRSPVARYLTSLSMRFSDSITVRDPQSLSMLRNWGLGGHLTADPVWSLAPGKLPGEIESELNRFKNDGDGDTILIGLSLREHASMDENALRKFKKILAASLPPNAVLVPLVLQKDQDSRPLDSVIDEWTKEGRAVLGFDADSLVRPSQWLALIGRLDFVVGMRLHSLIMALGAEVPVFGLSYDPKVEKVMKEFGQPFLNLINDRAIFEDDQAMEKLLKEALLRRQDSIQSLKKPLDEARRAACMNIQFIDRILGR